MLRGIGVPQNYRWQARPRSERGRVIDHTWGKRAQQRSMEVRALDHGLEQAWQQAVGSLQTKTLARSALEASGRPASRSSSRRCAVIAPKRYSAGWQRRLGIQLSVPFSAPYSSYIVLYTS